MYGSEREPQLWRTSTLIHRLPFAQHSHRSSDGIAWRYCALSPVANASRSFRRHTGTSGPFTCRQSAHQALRLWLDSQVVYAKRQPSNLWACCTAASLCTLGYATLAGFWGLLMARLLWGVSFAALNISRQALITAEPAGASRRSGRSQSIVAVGPLLGLLGGAFLSQWLGPRAVFFLLTAVALLGLLFALQLPAGAVGPYPKSPKKFRWPKPLHLWSFVQGLALDGFFTTSLSVLSAQALPENAALAAGAVMALRYLGNIVLSPLGGYMAGRWGAENQLLGLSFAAAIAMLGIGLEWLWISAVAVVILRSLVIPMVSLIVAMQNPGPARVEALAACTVWRDLGAGIGPMLAGALLPIGSNLILYTGAAAMIAVSVIACYFELKK